MRLVAIPSFLLLFPTVGVVAPPAVAPPPRLAARAPAAARPEIPGTVQGVVTAADADSVTIRGFDLRYFDTRRRDLLLVSVGGRGPYLCTKVGRARDRVALALTLPGGEVMTFRRADMPARRFVAGDGPDPIPGWASYRPADVRVGDEVTLWLDPNGPDGEFRGIQIERRPGGRVPPAPGEDPDTRNPWHDYANAWQDWEERGIPLPEKYDPAVAREMIRRNREAGRQFFEEQAARERTAPPPRLAKPKPPGR
ncbi:MAG: hypothetical protein K2X82_24720 [Gemmataceae bacterium]|nr:hypothetical protein [Gemmataceae bacterium]